MLIVSPLPIFPDGNADARHNAFAACELNVFAGERENHPSFFRTAEAMTWTVTHVGITALQRTWGQLIGSLLRL